MGEAKQIEIKKRTYYFYNYIINLENVEPNLLTIDKKYYKDINIFYNGYITVKKIAECGITSSVNPLFFRINHANGYIEEENGN